MYREALRNSESWGNTTDPAQHDPNNYRYLVHAINSLALGSAIMSSYYDKRDGVTYDPQWGDQSISMYTSPERLSERVSLSTSLVDNKHTATWGPVGLIVAAPPENIICTSSEDIGTANNNLDRLLAQRTSPMNPDDLLRNTHPHAHNEVVVLANHNKQPVRLAGFFYKAATNGAPQEQQLTTKMQEHAYRLGLPIVPIIEKQWWDNGDRIVRNEAKITATYRSRYYLLSGFEESQFRYHDEHGRILFSAPDDIEGVLKFAVEQGELTDANAKELKNAYTAVRQKRHEPSIVFDQNGVVQSISCLEGYGVEEEEIMIRAGVVERTNLVARAEELESSFAGGIRLNLFTRIRQNESDVKKADCLIKRACDNLDLKTAERVRGWYASNRPKPEPQVDFSFLYKDLSSIDPRNIR